MSTPPSQPGVPDAFPPPAATPVQESATTRSGGPGTFSSPGTGEPPSPTRGAPLTDFKSVELEIAGIFTDLAQRVEAPTASVPTLRGSVLAEHTGQRAPTMPEHAEIPSLPEKK